MRPTPCNTPPLTKSWQRQQRYPSTPSLVNIASANPPHPTDTQTDLKTTLDDHTPIYLSASNTPSSQPLPRPLRFTPSHRTTYIKLGIGYSAVAIALYTFYLDYVLKKDFADTKAFTTLAVIAYFGLNAALTLWTWFGEKGLIFEGSRTGKSPATLQIHSLVPHRKFDPTYRISATWTAKGGRQTTRELTVPFTRFFAADGLFVPAAYEAWLRKEIPLFQDAVEPTRNDASSSLVTVEVPMPSLSAEPAAEEDDVVVIDGALAGGVDGSPSVASGNASAVGGKKRSKRKA